MEVLSLIVNLIMATLLLVTIWYCWRLNVRIRVLQDSRSELARIIREFDESTQRATDSIAEIHQATQRLSENMQHKIDKANFLATDLEFMIERGNKMVGGRADSASRQVSAREPAVAALASSRVEMEKLHNVDVKDNAPQSRTGRMRSRAEQELLSMLKKDGR